MSKNSIKFNRVSSESQYESIAVTATRCGCTVSTTDFMTKVTVHGTDGQLEKFRKEYDACL